MKWAHKKGFTLTELVITLAVAGIFLTIGVPGYYTLIQNNKAVSMVNQLASSLNAARMEAIKRGVRVSVCPAANAALTSCGTNAQWAQGWIVFVDADNNNAIDSTSDLLRVQQALPAATSATTTAAMVSYDGTGFVTSAPPTFTLAATGCTGNNARTLSVSASGRISIVKANCP